MNFVSDIYLVSSLSFLFTMYSNLTFEFILHPYSFFFFLLLSPVEGFCCRPKCWANIIHRFVDQNSLTSKCIPENWGLFEKLTHSQRSVLSVCPRGPRGCAQRKALKSQLFFVQFKDAYISTFQRPNLH